MQTVCRARSRNLRRVSMSINKVICRTAVCLCALILPCTSAWAQFNGLKVNPRVFNDYPNSTLTISTSNSVPGTATIDDRNMVNATGNGANRHDILLSADNGATAYTFNPNQTWQIQ